MAQDIDAEERAWVAKLKPGQIVTVTIEEKINTMNPRGDITLSAKGVEDYKVGFNRGSLTNARLLAKFFPWGARAEGEWYEDDEGDRDDDEGDGEYRTLTFKLRVKAEGEPEADPDDEVDEADHW